MIRDFYCDREQTSALIKPREKGESKTSRELVHNEHDDGKDDTETREIIGDDMETVLTS